MEPEILTAQQKWAAARIIAGHDVSRLVQAQALLDGLAATPVTHKIGLRAILRGQHLDLLKRASGFGVQVMLDAKLYDVDATCKDAVGMSGTEDLEDEGVFHYPALWGITVSAFAGPKTLEALVQRCNGSSAAPIAVGYLTSISPEHFARMGSRFATLAEAQVHILGLAYECGIRRFVCSGLELEALLAALPSDAEFIVPGVRMEGEPAKGQERIVEPKFAVSLAPNRVKVVIGGGIASHVGKTPGPFERLQLYADHIASVL